MQTFRLLVPLVLLLKASPILIASPLGQLLRTACQGEAGAAGAFAPIALFFCLRTSRLDCENVRKMTVFKVT